MFGFARALDQGIISPTLLRSWEIAGMTAGSRPKMLTSLYVKMAASIAALLASVSLFACHYSLILTGQEWENSPFAHWTLGIGLFLLPIAGAGVLAYIFTARYADWRFMKDCRRLAEVIHAPGHSNKGELIELSQNHLVSRAYEVIYAQYQYGIISDQAERAKKCFREDHAVLLKFAFANEGWKGYFDLAEAKIKLEQERIKEHVDGAVLRVTAVSVDPITVK